MKSLIPFSITTSNKSINRQLLNGDAGLEKNEFLNVYYNDSIGKRELVQELLMSCCLPKEWGSSDEPKEIDNGQELGAVLIDIQGSFSAYKFVQKLRAFYEKNDLIEGSRPGKDWPSEEAKAKAMKEDKHEFIKSVLKNLYIFNCMDAMEFNLTIRSLASFFKTHKSIGLVIIDGLHYIENLEYLYQQEKRFRDDERKAVESGKGHSTTIQALADQMGDDIPGIDDFFEAPTKKEEPAPVQTTNAANQRKTMLLPTTGRGKKSSATDAKAFDQKLVDRALHLLLDFQSVHQFSIVKCQARPQMKRSVDIQEDIMSKGLDPAAEPLRHANSTIEAPGLPGLGQLLIQGQIATDDDQLRDRIKGLRQGEVLVLKGEKKDSLSFVGKENEKMNENFMTQHLSCLIMPHHSFGKRNLDAICGTNGGISAKYLNRYLALYVLFKNQHNLYNISADFAKSFYM